MIEKEGEGKTVVVTGGSRGIGRGICRELARLGYTVSFTYHTGQEEAKITLGKIEAEGVPGSMHRVDLSSREALQGFVRDLRSKTGQFYALVNNAGIYVGEALRDTTDDSWDKTLKIDLEAPFLLSRELAPSIERGGSILNISSVYGLRTEKWGYPYLASKSALIHLTRAMAKELAPDIRVNCLAPGYIRTDMNTGAWTDPQFKKKIEKMTPAGRWGEVEDIARVAGFLLSKDSSFITGAVLSVDGGIGIP